MEWRKQSFRLRDSGLREKYWKLREIIFYTKLKWGVHRTWVSAEHIRTTTEEEAYRNHPRAWAPPPSHNTNGAPHWKKCLRFQLYQGGRLCTLETSFLKQPTCADSTNQVSAAWQSEVFLYKTAVNLEHCNTWPNKTSPNKYLPVYMQKVKLKDCFF